jgi:hypothetical protein
MPGFGEAATVWALFGFEAAAIYRTYSRGAVPPGGVEAGVSHVRIFLRHPTLAGTVATLPIVLAHRPGSRRGFALWRDGDAARRAIGTGLLVWSLPWIYADLGIYIGDAPLFDRYFRSRQPWPPGTSLPAVHLGHHHGMDGALLAMTALILSRTLPDLRAGPPREGLSLYLAGVLVYGMARAAEDGWHEQVVKRGWTTIRLPRVVRYGRPVGRRMWTGMAVATVAINQLWFRRPTPILACQPPR